MMIKTVCLFLLAGVARAGSLAPQDLRCEYHPSPAVIDAVQPRLSWLLSSDQREQKQTAYQVLASSDPAKLAADRGDLWDSGKVNSNQTIFVVYGGKPLTSRMRCYWKVRVWDKEDHPSAYSAPAEWAMGLLQSSDWKGKWIGDGREGNKNLPLLRREFTVAKQPQRATLYLCGLGSFEAHLNGQKVGDNVLEPGWTNYRKRCVYRTYDVTKQIRKGVNAIGVMLGNGMYNVTGGRYVQFLGSFGPPTMILQLEIEFTDGTSKQVISDGSWRVVPGPITFSCIYGGEDYDGRREQDGWDAPGFDDSGWKNALVMEGPGGRLAAESAPPVKIMREYEPVKVTEPKPGTYVYDLGQNFAGWPALSVSGPAGTTVKLIPGELLDDRGLVKQGPQGTPSSFSYTLRGTGNESWHPRFSYYGLRYVQVEGAAREDSSGKAVVHNMTGQFIHSSSETSGSFSCSNDLFNRIHALINAAILSNMQSVLTGCPHREKIQWLEQLHFMAPSIMLNYDVARLYSKALDDMREAQLPNGLVPDTAPEYVVFRGYDRDSPEWGSAYVEAPWYVYQYYGDMEPLRNHYAGMRAYVDYLTSRAKDSIISYGVGDWILPENLMFGMPPKGLTGTAVYYRDLSIIEQTAALLGYTADSEKYGKLRVRVGQAFDEKFLNPSTRVYVSGNQVSNAMPLVLGIAGPECAGAIVKAIVENIRSLNNHTTAGEIGLRYVLQALSDAGRSDVIYDMLSRTDVPSYGYQLSRGATSLTEAWDTDPNESQNMFMLGEAEEWFYKALAGIGSDPDAVGFDRIMIKPEPVGDVKWCTASYRSVRGPISSHWEIVDRDLHLTVAIPPNTTATVFVPASSIDAVTEGGHAAAESEGLKLLRVESGRAVFAAASGTYNFISRGFKR